VELRELLHREEPDPDEERNLALLRVPLRAPGRLEEGLLQHVRGVDPRVEARVEPELDEAPQARPELLEPPREGRLVHAAVRHDPVELVQGGPS